ncbi:MAG: bifunctional enzyme CysN/CysC [Alphaproteobacteria bacterium]|jgi:bifunctional enzyme CysN/CysC|nr:bifunctional enzyme CysN/CysC [Alphaproteobacteria bacterium]
MATSARAAVTKVAAYMEQQEAKDLLRFITCGSVDDGKSTLIGRLLYDCRLLYEDQLAALKADSARYGTGGKDRLDFALLVDGLAAEREQGITIDVAYRYFSTPRRKFIVADTPGHEDYTRNMATGASTADAAVVLVDARKGAVTQTRRHGYLLSLLGIRQVAFAINKMDLVDWDRVVFERIAADCTDFAGKLGIAKPVCIPMCARSGDGVTRRGETMPWYGGPSLLDYLETVEPALDRSSLAFRMPVQWVNRPDPDFRGYCGTIASGAIAPGDPVVVLPSGRATRIARLVAMGADLAEAGAGQAVTVTLADAIDVGRGDVIAALQQRPAVVDQFAANVIWMGGQYLLPGRSYLLRIGTQAVNAQVTELKHVTNVDTLEHSAAKHAALNDVCFCNIALDRPVPIERYADNRELGGFIIIDRLTNATVGCGMIAFPLRRATNIAWQALKVTKAERSELTGQHPCVLWFTGLSGAGKSTIAALVDMKLHTMGRHTVVLDGDNIRHGLNKNLGFTDEDRVENVRRVAEVAKLMVGAGLIVMVSLISPFRNERRMARELVEAQEFIEIFVDAPLAVCEARDPKGLYRKARAGEIPNLTGIGSAYEPPQAPDIVLRSDVDDAEALASRVVEYLTSGGYLVRT